MVTHPVAEEKLAATNGVARPGHPATGALFTLRVMDTGETIPVSGRNEVTLGRISDKQPIVPDIDLTPYRAYEQGVSRLHASLHIDQFAATVVDLGSANGTRLNGRRMAPYEPQAVKNGDILTLGRFKVQLLFFAPNL
jgi:pSer/pThr/pTyr-binding forkhead associated (FHA) protein